MTSPRATNLASGGEMSAHKQAISASSPAATAVVHRDGAAAERLAATVTGAGGAGKPRPNHQRTLHALRSLTPEQKLQQVFQLNERMLALFRLGLRRRFPELDDRALQVVYLQLRQRCHNRNY